MQLGLFATKNKKPLLMRRTCSDQKRKEHETVEDESHGGGWSMRL
jgi:hypothetical protein